MLTVQQCGTGPDYRVAASTRMTAAPPQWIRIRLQAESRQVSFNVLVASFLL
jgi:hypothetical protein